MVVNNMLKLKQKILRKFSEGVKDTSGSATVESVLWIPIFFGFFVFIADVSFIFYGQSQIYRVVQDANRNLSIGRLETELETEDFITNALLTLSPNSTVTTTINGGTVTTKVVTPTSDLMATGLITSFIDIDLNIGSSHLVEY